MPWGGSSPRRPTASPWSYRLWWRSKMGRAAKRPSLWGTLGLALFAVVLVLLYWYAPALPEMARDYAREAFRLMGLGVAIPGFLLLVLLILWRLGRPSYPESNPAGPAWHRTGPPLPAALAAAAPPARQSAR